MNRHSFSMQNSIKCITYVCSKRSLKEFQLYMLAFAFFICSSCDLNQNGESQDVTVISWNAKELFDMKGLKKRLPNFRELIGDQKPDIILLQEFTSIEQVEALAEALKLENWSLSCSDFNMKDHNRFNSFEVAILSRFPLSNVTEYDPYPERRKRKNYPFEKPLEVQDKSYEKIRTSRGFLVAEIEELKLMIGIVHLKSSIGKEGELDYRNAQKREFVTIALTETLNTLSNNKTDDWHILIGGDFNVGHSDKVKNGKDLFDDVNDGYDDTHAILTEPLIGDIKFTNALAKFNTTTYPSYKGSPIDNLYVNEGTKFKSSEIIKNAYGSDHYPVKVVLELQP
ncbi:exonuclease III [Sediminitomix flava]|uniref:Exonuclease III n=2 Tax=Sediminitomix flava TaxID=379075 RepID=A0A316A234_SEDFL|nr:exonuclease III [Sediminitomix flava]